MFKINTNDFTDLFLFELILNITKTRRIFEFSSLFINDFEETVFPKHPIIADIKKRLLDAGAFYASMSGSGSTVYGLFKNDPEGCTDANLAVLKQQLASMVLLDDTFGEWKS